MFFPIERMIAAKEPIKSTRDHTMTKNKEKNTIKFLHATLLRSGITLAQVAEETGYSRTYISRVLLGKDPGTKIHRVLELVVKDMLIKQRGALDELLQEWTTYFGEEGHGS